MRISPISFVSFKSAEISHYAPMYNSEFSTFAENVL